jgi:hypothetical protein
VGNICVSVVSIPTNSHRFSRSRVSCSGDIVVLRVLFSIPTALTEFRVESRYRCIEVVIIICVASVSIPTDSLGHGIMQ